jgi:hypothetical protein
VQVVEAYDEQEYTAFKCLDPDGHRVEAYWEPPFNSATRSEAYVQQFSTARDVPGRRSR